MFRICLINMPFASLNLPSIALTQMKSRLKEQFKDRVSVEVLYLNHDFGKYLGVEFYNFLSDSMQSLNAGLGDWVFRQLAFPDQPDNTSKYFERYFPGETAELQVLKRVVSQKRPGLGAFVDQLLARHELDKAQVVGFTSMFMQNTASFAMARKIKRRNPDVITVIGGANCEFPMGAVIAEQIRSIDFVFSGPALKSFPEFIGFCLEGEKAKCSSIRGVFAKGAPLPSSGPETIGEDLNLDVPIELDYRTFVTRLGKYFPDKEVKPSLSFETSRGCWWGERAHCTFCGLNGVSMGYRSMKPQLAIDLIKSLFQYSGKVKRLSAVDNILPKSYLQEVLPFLETPENMEIFYEVKADLSELDIATLAKARVTQIQPGIEALATSTLKLMKKGTTAFQNVNFLKSCTLHNVQPHWNLLMGFPGENEEVYRRYEEMIPLLVHLYPPSGAYPVRFDRFSPYFYQAEVYKLNLQPLDFYSMIYPFKDVDLKNVAYYFGDANLQADYAVCMSKWINRIRPRIADWQARWSDSKIAPPRLNFKGDSTIVYDSRFAAPAEHDVGIGGKAVLNHLARPVQTSDLAKFCSTIGLDASQEVALLHQKKLLFQENDRLLSLVVDGRHITSYLHPSLPVANAVAGIEVQS